LFPGIKLDAWSCMRIRSFGIRNHCPIFVQLLAAIVLMAPASGIAAVGHLQCRDIFDGSLKSAENQPEVSSPSSVHTASEGLSLIQELDKAATQLGLSPNWRETAHGSIDVRPKRVRFSGGLSGNPDPNQVGKDGILFGVDYKSPDEKAPMRLFTAPELNDFPYSGFLGESLELKGQKFRLINVGYEQVRREVQKLNPFLDSILKKVSFCDVFVTLNDKFLRGLRIITQFANLGTVMTTEVYKKHKSYLKNEDLFEMYWNDLFETGRSDYFLVMNDSGQSPLEMTELEARNSLLAGLKVVRPSATFFGTYLDSFRRGKLPFLSRLNSRDAREVKSFLDSLVQNGKQVAELSRFAKFGDVPPEIMRTLVHKALEQGSKQNGGDIDVFLFACDAKTRRQFAIYGFTDLIAIHDAESPEFIMMLDTNSDNYKKTMAMLESVSKEVKNKKITNALAERQWSGSWSGGIERFQYSPEFKGKDSEKFLQRLRMEVRESHQKIPNPITIFSDSAVTSEARAKEIAAEVLRPSVSLVLKKQIESKDNTVMNNVIRNALLFMPKMEETAAFVARNLPSEGRIFVTGRFAAAYAELIGAQYNGRIVEVFSENNLPEAQAQADAVLILNGVIDHTEREHVITLAWAQEAVKGHRQIITFDPLSSASENGLAGQSEIQARLDAEAVTAVRNRAPMTEFELALALRLLQGRIP
jgi:hypothetical protein